MLFRSHALSLTSNGRKKRAQAQTLWKQAQLQLNDTVGVDDVIALHALIDRMTDALSTDAAEQKEAA